LQSDKRNRVRRACGVFFIISIMLICATPQYRAVVTLPKQMRITQSQDGTVLLQGVPVLLTARTSRAGFLSINGRPVGPAWQLVRGQSLALSASAPGTVEVDFRLLGLIPYRTLTVEVVPPLEVRPGGHSIGVLLRSRGVMVVEHSPVAVQGGETVYPAREAGIRVGDIIREINAKAVTCKEDIADLVNAAGEGNQPARLTVERRGTRLLTIPVTPSYDVREQTYRLGLWVRDGTAGVGTLSFYNAETGRYIALGHEISDPHSQIPIEVRDGQIVRANVSGIHGARNGDPGEKIGVFTEAKVIGSIDDNTPFGIVGNLNRDIQNPDGYDSLPLALQRDIHEGPATLLTVVRGENIEQFDIRIERARAQQQPAGKSMVIRITDPDLLRRTGGIVQGMSGSPIIQEGQLVGAITHVFVNDPARGYAVYAEWMALEAGMTGMTCEPTSGMPARLIGIAAAGAG